MPTKLRYSIGYTEVLKVVFGDAIARQYRGNAVNNFVPYRVDAPINQAYLESSYHAISDLIKQDRIRKRLSISAAAKSAGISDRTLWKYENKRLAEELMDITVLQRLGGALANDPFRYLSTYHRWVVTSATQDIGWLLEHHSYKNLEELARACGTTHRSLYLWRDGVGQPSHKTWQIFLAHLTSHLTE